MDVTFDQNNFCYRFSDKLSTKHQMSSFTSSSNCSLPQLPSTSVDLDPFTTQSTKCPTVMSPKFFSFPLRLRKKYHQMDFPEFVHNNSSAFNSVNFATWNNNNLKSSSSSSSSDESGTTESSITAKFSELTKRQWATIAMLALANLCSTVAFSCIAPFYPAEAELKGMSQSEIGLVFGIFELVIFVMAPILGKYMAVIGSKLMFSSGLFITGITAIAFGVLNLLPPGSVFFWASLIVRCTEALGDACFVTSSFAISAKNFPGRIATIVGIMETFAGLGYTAGPVIGSVLYEYGGFQLPFFVLGILLILVTFLSYNLVEGVEDESSDDAMGMLSMLRIPVIWLMVFAVIICAVSLSFFDPTLSGHLKSFDLSTITVGMFFLLCSGFYCLTAPLWGLLLDRWRYCCNALMLFGSAATVVSMLLIGPSPLFVGLEKSLVLIGLSLAVLGVAASALYVPIFQNCLNSVKENGYDDSFQTYGYVSGVFQSAFAFGGFIGPTLGGFGVEAIGLPNTTTIIAVINLLFIFVLLSFFLTRTIPFYSPSSSSSNSSSSKKRNSKSFSSSHSSSSTSSPKYTSSPGSASPSSPLSPGTNGNSKDLHDSNLILPSPFTRRERQEIADSTPLRQKKRRRRSRGCKEMVTTMMLDKQEEDAAEMGNCSSRIMIDNNDNT